MSLLDDSSVLITGGTGSLGKALVKHLLENTKVRRVAIFSRDELKQLNMRNEFKNDSRLRWFLGDVRDFERLHHFVQEHRRIEPAGMNNNRSRLVHFSLPRILEALASL